jgi:hypothetical protein
MNAKWQAMEMKNSSFLDKKRGMPIGKSLYSYTRGGYLQGGHDK